MRVVGYSACCSEGIDGLHGARAGEALAKVTKEYQELVPIGWEGYADLQENRDYFSTHQYTDAFKSAGEIASSASLLS